MSHLPRARSPLAAIALAMALAGCAGTASGPESGAGAEEGTGECTWGCLRWERRCGVDPRGVYSCRRTCAEFGEVCEEEGQVGEPEPESR